MYAHAPEHKDRGSFMHATYSGNLHDLNLLSTDGDYAADECMQLVTALVHAQVPALP